MDRLLPRKWRWEAHGKQIAITKIAVGTGPFATARTNSPKQPHVNCGTKAGLAGQCQHTADEMAPSALQEGHNQQTVGRVLSRLRHSSKIAWPSFATAACSLDSK
jgi:hypothetical protein